MNPNDPFEDHLKRQPLRRIPESWRKEILAAAKAERTVADVMRDFPSKPPKRKEFSWPSPVAWAGLACVWFVILGLNLATPETKPTAAMKQSPLSPEILQAVFEQRRMVAQYLDPVFDPFERARAKPSKPSGPGPRSDRQTAIGVA